MSRLLLGLLDRSLSEFICVVEGGVNRTDTDIVKIKGVTITGFQRLDAKVNSGDDFCLVQSEVFHKQKNDGDFIKVNAKRLERHERSCSNQGESWCRQGGKDTCQSQ